MRVADRVLAWLTILLGVVWTTYTLALGSDAGLTVPVLLVHWWGGIALIGLCAVWLVVHVLATRATPASRHVRRRLVVPALLLLCFGLVWTGAAFRLRFLLSRPALERFVRDARPSIVRGEFRPGVRVGLFRIQEAEAMPGDVVRLITTNCMFDDCGVVYSPAGSPPVVGEDTYKPLGAHWWHWWRSW
jgi:hypothetical protein